MGDLSRLPSGLQVRPGAEYWSSRKLQISTQQNRNGGSSILLSMRRHKSTRYVVCTSARPMTDYYLISL